MNGNVVRLVSDHSIERRREFFITNLTNKQKRQANDKFDHEMQLQFQPRSHSSVMTYLLKEFIVFVGGFPKYWLRVAEEEYERAHIS
jgi:hypothetical protein